MGARELLLFAEAWLTLAWMSACLRWTSGRIVREALAVPQSGSRPLDDSRLSPLAIAVARAAVRHLAPMECLPRALALCRMARRRGASARLRLGVRRDGEILAAHAWVELEGSPVGEPEGIESRFLPLLERLRPGFVNRSPPREDSGSNPATEPTVPPIENRD